VSTQILSWNVAGRVRSVADQAAAVTSRADADVVALQEIRASAHRAWSEALAAAGWRHQHYSAPPGDRPERRLGVLIASRRPVEPLLPIDGLPWPERYAGVHVDGLDVHALHAPISAKAERVKVVTLERVAEALGDPDGPPAVLVGDLNTPAYESREGEVRSFARTRGGALRDGFDERHDRAELGLVPGLAARGAWVDAFRATHGYGARDRSWMYANRKFGYRLDHAFARGVAVKGCDYVHAWREAGLSDHSALWVDVCNP
jgi:exonuclease III